LVWLRLTELPAGVQWRQVIGIGWLGGIGFTMSLFITGHAFPGGELAEAAKLGILVGSLLAGAAGFFLLRSAPGSPNASGSGTTSE
jgi:NhaA family Na+:H+ antiporter